MCLAKKAAPSFGHSQAWFELEHKFSCAERHVIVVGGGGFAHVAGSIHPGKVGAVDAQKSAHVARKPHHGRLYEHFPVVAC